MQLKTYFWIPALVLISLLLAGHGKRGDVSASQKVRRAVLFGVSTYTDSLFVPILHAKSDAEQMAAFLRTRSGGFTPAELIKLNTGEDATLAQFIAELSWVQEESLPKDEVLVFLTCHARLMDVGGHEEPYLFFHNAPYTPAGAGGLPLTTFIKSIHALRKNTAVDYQLYLNLKIEKAQNKDLWKGWMYAYQRSFESANFNFKANLKAPKLIDRSLYVDALINGLVGAADFNKDDVVLPAELIKYLNKKNNQLFKNDLFFLGFSSKGCPVSESNQKLINKIKKDNYAFWVGQEVTNIEDSLLRMEHEKVQSWYSDFIINLKLGKLMYPPGLCASDLYDSLSMRPSLQPLCRNWQRKLGVALLDETQQVLNGYLKTNTLELFRREKNSHYYEQYPTYMKRAMELIGDRYFMQRTLKTKFHYFEGLKYRLQSERFNETALLKKARKAQLQALNCEPNAAYVLNELGVVHDLLGSDSAAFYYLQALDCSPSWCIPKLNLSIHYREKQDFERAYVYAVKSLKYCPGNVIALNHLGTVYILRQQYGLAEKCFRQAIAFNQKYHMAYYNLSCVKAIQGDKPAALHWLEEALKYGYDDWSLMERDPDLTDIVLTEAFLKLKAKYYKTEAAED